MALPPYSAFLFIILQLLCKISSNDFGKSGNIPDICKILSKNLLLRRQIFLFPGENTQHAHSLAAQLTDLGCSVSNCVLPMIRCRILRIGTIDNNIVRTSITENDQNLFLFLPGSAGRILLPGWQVRHGCWMMLHS